MLIRSAEQDIERVIYTEKAIAARVEEIGTELTKKLGDKRPVLVCVLKGASFFYIDLCRSMNCAIDMDFIAVSSYGASAKSTGVVRLIKDLDNNITGRHVIIVEDIVDSGFTLSYLSRVLSNRGAASVRIFIRGRRARRVNDRHGLLGSQSDRGKRRTSCRVQTVLTSACLHRAGPRKASCRAAAQYEL